MLLSQLQEAVGAVPLHSGSSVKDRIVTVIAVSLHVLGTGWAWVILEFEIRRIKRPGCLFRFCCAAFIPAAGTVGLSSPPPGWVGLRTRRLLTAFISAAGTGGTLTSAAGTGGTLTSATGMVGLGSRHLLTAFISAAGTGGSRHLPLACATSAVCGSLWACGCDSNLTAGGHVCPWKGWGSGVCSASCLLVFVTLGLWGPHFFLKDQGTWGLPVLFRSCLWGIQ